MQTLTAKDEMYGFGPPIDLARAEPVAVAKHGRPVVMVMAVEEFERLSAHVAVAAAKPSLRSRKRGWNGRQFKKKAISVSADRAWRFRR
jgi:PHD/YefM family antitoxin component YafN of YafNO toxin-antitoxin module